MPVGSWPATCAVPSPVLAGLLTGRAIDALRIRARRARRHVLIFTTIDCPISNRYAPEIITLSASSSRAVTLLAGLANPADTDAAIAAHTRSSVSDAGASRSRADAGQRTGVTVAPEAAVLMRAGGGCIAGASTIATSRWRRSSECRPVAICEKRSPTSRRPSRCARGDARHWLLSCRLRCAVADVCRRCRPDRLRRVRIVSSPGRAGPVQPADLRGRSPARHARSCRSPRADSCRPGRPTLTPARSSDNAGLRSRISR